jgi:hypothetical protein
VTRCRPAGCRGSHFYAGHWKAGTIARELGVHPDAVRQAIASGRFHRAMPLRPARHEPFLRGHVHAFQAWSGQPRVILYDNLRSGRSGPLGAVPDQ